MAEHTWVTRDGSTHHTTDFEIKKQQAEVASHDRLVQQQLGNCAPQHGKQRVPLYTRASEKRPTSELVPHAPDRNTATDQMTADGTLSLDQLTAQRRHGELIGAFSVECLARIPADIQLLQSCGYRLSGMVGKSESGENVIYQRWRLCLRTGE